MWSCTLGHLCHAGGFFFLSTGMGYVHAVWIHPRKLVCSLKRGHFRRKCRFPTIKFQGRCLLVSGRATFPVDIPRSHVDAQPHWVTKTSGRDGDLKWTSRVDAVLFAVRINEEDESNYLTWPIAKLFFLITYLVGKIKFTYLFQGPLAKWVNPITVENQGSQEITYSPMKFVHLIGKSCFFRKNQGAIIIVNLQKLSICFRSSCSVNGSSMPEQQFVFCPCSFYNLLHRLGES